ncbi:hypothetical protein [Williamsia sp. 1135]|uniref:hypothetical protein n=1 Tax=Williamsia sp. 1135 TaxID=1889262 RepID=UPI00143C066A|nr:hypothetical protein [Williamsia sp. 1135]
MIEDIGRRFRAACPDVSRFGRRGDEWPTHRAKSRGRRLRASLPDETPPMIGIV